MATAERARFEAPQELQTFADQGERRRLSGAAVKAVVRLVAAWGGSNAEGVLSQDQLTRASALIGIFKGLHLLFADDMADRWPKLRNRAPLFDRLSPIEAMIGGGIPRILETRQYIDALRGGL